MNYFFSIKKKTKTIAFVLFFILICILTSNAQVLGDANTSGTIDIVDALLTAQYFVGLAPTNFNAQYADVNGSGNADIVDALLIAQYYVGLITQFPGGQTPAPTAIPGGVAPKAAFTVSNIVPSLNHAVDFDASGSMDSDGTITAYEWNFGDDTTASGVTVTHAFSSIDDFKVVLTVTDNSGLTGKKTQRVMAGRPAGWTEATHSKSADGDYTVMFPDDKVLRVDVTISAADFQKMETDLATLNMNSTQNPVYVPCTVNFNGYTWQKVGIRYKGGSTLFYGPKISGKHKYPFHMNFDKMEDTYPEINGQRFYGFKEMLFNNNWFDPTYIRDKVCADLFRDGGIPTARGSFCRLYVNTGSGLVYWGLYTMFEDPSDELLKTQFEDSDGNMYKGQNATGSDLTVFNKAGFEKKTNEDADDWSDLSALVAALNASRSNAATWRAGLEAVFDTNSFLRWLAINTAIVNFDAYGWVGFNYYLYQDLSNGGRLVHVPWDFNYSLNTSGVPQVLSLSLSEVTNKWPLIRYLIDDPVYKNIYNQEMRTAIDGCFNQTTITAKMRQLHELIRPYVVGAEGELSNYTYFTNGTTQFNQGLTDLINHVGTRQSTVRTYLGL